MRKIVLAAAVAGVFALSACKGQEAAPEATTEATEAATTEASAPAVDASAAPAADASAAASEAPKM
ncbi:hypothetical protein [Novosphingobium sp. TH158]|uniref:hypothetical protein n=1 Tax=Novosphingobium sp. TH158 TaxID=2067455 RepID=UPI000C79E06D|nr:hypothetical protein [Novosphingobium sp. TH158]PLK27540.1 hypothetical protein C0V78_12065 [Novosphingobium sp. TH158]